MAELALPFNFTVAGPPVSQQTRNRDNLRSWREKVRDAAESATPSAALPYGSDVAIKITYYYDTDAPDVDNIIKPILDAIIGVVYDDDSQVIEATSRRRDINGPFRVRKMPQCLADSLVAGDDFIHVRVDFPPDPTEVG